MNSLLFLTEEGVRPIAEQWTFWLIIICVVPIAILIITAIVLAIKNARKKSLSVEDSADYEQKPVFMEAYGGEDNFISAKLEMSRITVKVKNIDLVDTEKLKELGAKNALLVGDEVKASFGDLAENIYKVMVK